MPGDNPRPSVPFEPRKNKRKPTAKKGTPIVKPQTATPTMPEQGSGYIPEVVSNRMIRRVLVFCGIPVLMGMGVFLGSYWVIANHLFKIANTPVLLTSMGCLGLSVLGLTYGILSASWDEEIDSKGSLLGWQEFKINFGQDGRCLSCFQADAGKSGAGLESVRSGAVGSGLNILVLSVNPGYPQGAPLQVNCVGVPPCGYPGSIWLLVFIYWVASRSRTSTIQVRPSSIIFAAIRSLFPFMQIHPTAAIEPGAQIGANVSIGPFCYIRHDVKIGDNCILDAHVTLLPYTSIGRDCHLHSNVVIGDLPQDLAFKDEPSYVQIGDNCSIREGVTIHRGTKAGTVTIVRRSLLADGVQSPRAQC